MKAQTQMYARHRSGEPCIITYEYGTFTAYMCFFPNISHAGTYWFLTVKEGRMIGEVDLGVPLGAINPRQANLDSLIWEQRKRGLWFVPRTDSAHSQLSRFFRDRILKL